MRKVLQLFLFFFISLYLAILMPFSVYAQSCDSSCGNLDECKAKISKCREAWDQMEAAKKPHVDALRKMEADIAAFQSRIKTIESSVIRKAQAIAEGEKELSGMLDLAGRRIRQFYKRTMTYNPLFSLLSSVNVGSVLRTVAYQQAATNEDKKMIIQTAILVKDLEDRKKILESERTSLAYLKDETDRRAASVRKLVGEATAYQGKLTSIIGSLTAKQQSFLAQKLAGLNLPTSLGAGPLYCTDDRKLNPGFSPAFAFFTFGIPHRVGMNQYGALGRAQAGRQSYQDILRAYFNGISFESGREDIKIKIQGHGERSLDEYLLGIYEMPENWDMNALKAQAVAARSYALAYTNNGQGEICTTQACQVWKPDKKTGQWKQAVEQTKGEVMVNGGQVIKAWYSSTDGGYTFTSGDVWGGDKAWTKRLRDTTGEVNSFDQLKERAYDKESPCFYAAQGWRSEYGKSAWLKNEEVADIANVILLARKDSSAREHLYQPDKPNPAGTDTWDREKVKQELRARGITPYNSVSDVSPTGVDWGVGRTTQITIAGDAGTNTFDGPEFKDFFNLRAPANIQIVGPLFNVERK
ncbi:SpoIID/LytB domain-containing protein [Patescibacteria group bacterium]|nr:SpoIID/LytB domain-containing protein [Patescibacteria group bacterium]MBU1472206.1 SpoIID/LytB domain-containing protein [Patescibacteria group bacterium]MBU2544159.1 SpoIID/LytB domain-containing protein [Patescibacteria group bacterium]